MSDDDLKEVTPVPRPVQLNYAHPVASPPFFGTNKDRYPSVAAVILAAFAATVICFVVASTYGSFGAGELFVYSMVWVGLCALFALGVAILKPPKSKRGLVGLAILCLLPAIIIAGILVTQYLQIGDADEFYQRTDSLDEVDTLRVSKEHTSVVFRNESDVRDQRTTTAPLPPATTSTTTILPMPSTDEKP